MKQDIHWKNRSDAEDFEAAANFLSLILGKRECKKLMGALRKAETIELAAKDLLRASQLPILPREEPHVDSDIKKIHKGKPLSPVLLVRGNRTKGVPLTIADGYHRICAIYYYNEDAPIRCQMVGG